MIPIPPYLFRKYFCISKLRCRKIYTTKRVSEWYLSPLQCREILSHNQQNCTIDYNEQINQKNKHPQNILNHAKLRIESNYLLSNTPIEDRLCFGTCFFTKYFMAGIFDGHLGSPCSHVLSTRFLNFLALSLLPNENLISLMEQLSSDSANRSSATHIQSSVTSNDEKKHEVIDNEENLNIFRIMNNTEDDSINNTQMPQQIPLEFYKRYIKQLIERNNQILKLTNDYYSMTTSKENDQNKSQNVNDGIISTSFPRGVLLNRETNVINRLEEAFQAFDDFISGQALSDMDDRTQNNTHSPNITSRRRHFLLGSRKAKPKNVRDEMTASWVDCAFSGSTACVAFIDYGDRFSEENANKVIGSDEEGKVIHLDENDKVVNYSNKGILKESIDKEKSQSQTMDEEPTILYVANVGDSRAVLGSIGPNGEWLTTKLSYKHYCENTWETRRILKEHPNDFEKAFLFKAGRLLGFLTPTRCFGDAMFKWPMTDILRARKLYPSLNIYVPSHYFSPPYLTAKPEIISHVLRPQDKFLVLASDGLWDFLHTRQVVKILGQKWASERNKNETKDQNYSSMRMVDDENEATSVDTADLSNSDIPRDFRPSSHEDALAESKIIEKQKMDEFSNMVAPTLSESDYGPDTSTLEPDPDCNSATWLMENALGGYGSQHEKQTIHARPEDNTDEQAINPLPKQKIIKRRHELDYIKLSTLLSLPEEIRRDFRDDIAIIVVYFE
ncbi:unnamed protein product [Gordionus sp. m RMFG-2023]